MASKIQPALATITKKRARPRTGSSTNLHKKLSYQFTTPSPTFIQETSPMTVTLLQALSIKHTHLPTTITPKLTTPPSRKMLGKGLDRLTEEEFVAGIVVVLQEMIDENDGTVTELPDRTTDLSIFYSTLKQPFGLGYYVGRLIKHMGCSRSIFVSALIYLVRLRQVDTRLGVCDLNVHRMLVTAAAVGAKWLEDEVYCNEYYQRVGGVPTVREFNRLEKVFLKKCDWRLTVGKGEFSEMEERVVRGGLDILSECDSD